jgi:uncharacterized damage-inducible protein DinB
MATPPQGPSPDFAIAYREMMLQSFTNEVQITKRVIAAIPDAKSDYKPDPKARTASELAWHLASTDIQFLDGIADLHFKMESPTETDKPRTAAELVSWYEQHCTRAINKIRALTPEQLVTNVNFMGAFNLPAVFYLGFLNNHSIHHRGELATYLRPMGSKVPAIYGGSYDEPWTGVSEETAA